MENQRGPRPGGGRETRTTSPKRLGRVETRRESENKSQTHESEDPEDCNESESKDKSKANSTPHPIHGLETSQIGPEVFGR